MIYIAHRGLIDGPDKKLENHPNQIRQSLDAGYDCEIDFWCLEFPSHRRYYLGHDRPDYEVEWDFFHQSGLWIHAKNVAALYVLTQSDKKLNYFWHQEDDFTLTSNGYLWTYPGKQLTDRSICVLPERFTPNLTEFNENCFGVCSKYVNLMK